MPTMREYSSVRWHSRAGFLATTLLALLAMGAPFLVTRGLLEHGALFLPGVLVLMLTLGGSLFRTALATGRLQHLLQGREAVHPTQMLVRLTIALVLLGLAGRAAGWILADTVFELPAHALEFRGRELTTGSTAWHTQLTPSFWGGLAIVVTLTGLLYAVCRRRRLAGLSWIAGWVLAAAVALLLLGLVVGYSLPGAGALAAMAAPLRLSALADISFWGDAAAITMLGLGAQAAVLTAAGRGLPQRAAIGREARILVTGISFLTVLGGLVGLLLLSALCVEQGVVPQVEHAAPGVLLLEVVPALGHQLFPNWPEEVRPTPRQITMAWCFLLSLACSLGAAALFASRRLLPDRILSRGSLFGIGAALAAALAVCAGWFTGTDDAWLPLMTVMPALLAVMHLTLTRRAGTDLRVAATAFASSRPWLESAQIMFTFRILRPLLLLLVLAVAVSRREYGLVLAGFAVSFALMWVGSLRQRPRSDQTGMLRPVSAAMLILLMAGVVHADNTPMLNAARQAAAAESAAERLHGIQHFEALWARGAEPDIPRLQAEAAALLAAAQEKQGPERNPAMHRARAVLACLLIADPTSDESLRLERTVLEADGLIPYARLDEAISDYAADRPQRLIDLLSAIQAHLEGEALKAALSAEAPLPQLLGALVRDLRAAYGTGGREPQRLRAHLLRRATTGRTLLKPDAGPGIVYISSVLAAAFALALAIMLGMAGELAPPRR